MGLLRVLSRSIYVVCVLTLAVLVAHGQTTPSSSSQTHTTTHHNSKKVRKVSHSKKSRRKPSWKRTQQVIQPNRAQEIQEALVRKHYLKGDPSGVWDSNTQAAMQRFQADHGWQTKMIPDSRALIALGLGPDHQHLLNPESAMTSEPVKSEVGKIDTPKDSQAPAAIDASVKPVATAPAGSAAPTVQPDVPTTPASNNQN